MSKGKSKKETEPVEEMAVEAPVEDKAPVAKTEGKALSAMETANSVESWGQSQISSKDIVIPRILLMQPMSEKVTAGDAAFGEFRESMNNEKLGDFNTGFKFIPFHMEKVFVEFNVEDPDDKKFLRIVPITPDNEDLPYEDEEKGEDGKKFKVSRDRTMNFYVLLPTELKLGGAIPYIISFRRTSLQAGKKLATQMYVKNHAAGVTPASITCEMTCGKQTEDKKTWAVMEVKPAEPTPAEYVQKAFDWLKIVKTGKTKVDEQSYTEEVRGEKHINNDGPLPEGPAKF